jgi:hypothetical protein
MAHSGTSCPSGRCRDQALLIGIVREDGSVAYLGAPLEIDEDFVAIASRGRPPETRFRFSEPCARDACGHWSDARCGLVEELVEDGAEVSSAAGRPALPRCGIRSTCVWFAQRGAEACGVCPRVVHSLMPRRAGPASAG